MPYEFKRFDDGEPLDVNKLNLIVDNITQLITDTAPLRDSTDSGQGYALVESGLIQFEDVTGNGTPVQQAITFKKISAEAAQAGKVHVVASLNNGLRADEDVFVSVGAISTGTPQVMLKVNITGKSIKPRATYNVRWIAVENKI
jgi:hypothetical protein